MTQKDSIYSNPVAEVKDFAFECFEEKKLFLSHSSICLFCLETLRCFFLLLPFALKAVYKGNKKFVMF